MTKGNTSSSSGFVNPADFISFILSHEGLTEEFCYMKRVGPYEFKIVPYHLINPADYYTISIRGVTHYVQGEVEFVSLSDWQRDQELYGRIASIPFFHKFRVWKSFVRWRRSILDSKYGTVSKQLTQNLFTLDPILGKSLKSVRDVLYRLQQYSLVDLEADRTYTAEEFAFAQQRQKDKLAKDINQAFTAVKDAVAQACRDSLAAFLTQNGFVESQAASSSSLQLAKQTAPAKMSYTERATRRTQCRRLSKFVRYVHYLWQTAIGQLARRSAGKLLDTLGLYSKAPAISEAPASPSGKSVPGGKTGGKQGDGIRPAFVVALSFVGGNDKGQTVMTPVPASFLAQMEASLSSSIDIVTSRPALLLLEDFKAYTSALVELGEELFEPVSDTHTLVSSHGKLVKTLKAVKESVAGYIEKGLVYVDSFDQYAAMESANRVFAVSALKEVQDFRSAILQFKKQIEAINAISQKKELHLFRFDGAVFIKDLLPSPTKCLEQIFKYLPVYVNQLTEQLLSEIKETNRRLSVLPANVDEFVGFTKYLDTTRDRVPLLEARAVVVSDFAELIKEFSVKIDLRLKSAVSEVPVLLNQLRTQLQLATDSCEMNITRFVGELDHDVPELRRVVAEYKTSLEDPVFGHVASVERSDEVLAKISDLETVVKLAENDAARYNRYQEVLKVEQSVFEDVAAVASFSQSVAKLWRGVTEWTKYTNTLVSTELAKLEVDAIQTYTQSSLKVAITSTKILADNQVAVLFLEKVNEFKNTLPVILALRNANLKSRHWDEIYDCIGEQFEVKSITLEQLLALNVSAKLDKIQEISNRASSEQSLEEMLAKLYTLWEELEFTLTPYKDSKDVYILTATEDVITGLEDSLVSASTIAASRYVGPIREEVESIQQQLLLLQETLDEWLTCQRQWIYLDAIFGSGDIRKQLPSESAKFALIDAGWKGVMRAVKEYPVALKVPTSSTAIGAAVASGSLESSGSKSQGAVPALLQVFRHYNSVLDVVSKSLEDFLQSKRLAFARFFFLANDELLEILGQGKNVNAVQPHLRKCFDNLVRLKLAAPPAGAAPGGGAASGGSREVLGMVSSEDEEVLWGKPLKLRGNVEKWLGDVEEGMRRGVHNVVKKGFLSYGSGVTGGSGRGEWVLSAGSGQVVSTVGMIMWCQEVESVLTMGQDREKVEPLMKQLYEKCVSQLSELTTLVRSGLSSLHRKWIVALVTQDVHNRDITENLYVSKVAELNNFLWQQQLRYYWSVDEDNCIVRQVDASLHYGWEYEGATSRLVITPLTDRCWMTITGALHIKLGAAPAGPAGTGKTESCKDLAKAVAIQCVVFNCSDQIDFKMMGKLFSGIISTGSWTCLDEFNRISIEVLSVIAQQLLVIRQALLAHQAEFQFEGSTLKTATDHMGVFITMNPGYAGRTELPDNLKILFRPVSMMVPDYTLIAEIMLFGEGFGSSSPAASAKVLSGKFTKLFKLSSEQLSKQDHYDFGMRAVKSVLVMAGQLKRAEPDLDEQVLLIRAMRDSNVPKFLSQDLPLFNAIVSDLFPGVEVPFIDYGSLKVEVESALRKEGLTLVPEGKQVLKVIQLHETFNVRFGVMLVGPTGGGKTVVYKALARAMSELASQASVGGHNQDKYMPVKFDILNPKAITMGELYGEFNELTQEWTDGLGSSLIRGSVTASENDVAEGGVKYMRWTVFDGPVDALWIESMNTVLDDNMTLCLANGERIKLKPQSMRMLFEVADLSVASPATVSRCGMVYVNPGDLGWRVLVHSWLEKKAKTAGSSELFNETVRAKILRLFEDHVDAGLGWLRSKGNLPIAAVDQQLVASIIDIFDAVLSRDSKTPNGCVSKDALRASQAPVEGGDEAAATAAAAAPQPSGISGSDAWEALSPAAFEKLAVAVFGFAYIWAIGGACDTKSKLSFESFAEKQLEDVIALPRGGGGVFDGFIDVRATVLALAASSGPGGNAVKMTNWTSLVPDFKYSDAGGYASILVANADTIKFGYLLDRLLGVAKPVFVTGMTGTGKSAIVQSVLNALSVDYGVVAGFLSFSAQTDAARTQQSIESKLEKKRKNLLGAPVNKSVAIFIDDVNMPAVEEYGAQPPIELLRQYLDLHGFYDRKKLFWKDVENTTLLFAAAPPGGGRREVSQRFTRHSTVLCMPNTSEEAMNVIFGSILSGFLAKNKFKPDVQTVAGSLVSGTLEVYNKISAELLPTPIRAHYLFNLRDVSKVFQGVCMVKPGQCQTPEALIRLWVHEVSRVFGDRLVSHADIGWFRECVAKVLAAKLRVELSVEEVGSVLFGDYLRGPGATAEMRVYEEIKDVAKATKILEDSNEEYNMTHSTPMNLVFFKDALDHVSRVLRVLRQERGNLLLVGVGGSGRSSLTRLGASMAEMAMVQIELTKGYKLLQFREDEKKLLVRAGGAEGQGTVFMMSDTQIVNETFLEDINNILNSGEVTNLFAADEVDKIVGDLRPLAKKEGRSEAKDAVYQWFVERVRKNLHIVLCMSPVGDALRVRMRMFPSLVNCTTIDWYFAWPDDALQAVADKLIKAKFSASSTGGEVGGAAMEDATKEALAAACVTVHQSVLSTAASFLAKYKRHVYVTPKSYLDLIALFVDLLQEKRTEKLEARERLAKGLNKLQEANDVVNKLQAELTALQPVLVQKQKEAEELIVTVTGEREKADVVKAKVSAEEAEVREQAKNVENLQAEAQRDLDIAMPALETALKSLDALDKKDIVEIKSFPKPPPLVMMTMEAVNILLGEKPDWDTAKRVLGDSSFMQKLKEYDRDNISPAILKKLAKYIEKPEYQPNVVGNQSKAAKSLCMWTHAMDTYSKVAKEVEPKKLKLKEMDEALAKANAELAGKQRDLQVILDKVDDLRRTLSNTENERDRLVHEAELTKARLGRADVLTGGLADEAVRWKESVASIDKEISDLVGNVFMAAASISYYGPFTGAVRAELVRGWTSKVRELGLLSQEAEKEKEFELVDILGNAVEMRDWNIQGLPSDSVSMDNGLLVTRCRRWPLLIDPQEQANKWIKKKEGKMLQTVKLNNSKLLLIVENAIRMGNPLLIEDVGEFLDPALEPVLVKAITNVNGRKMIHLGDQDVEYHADFRLYITSKMPNPHYYPEISIRVTLINFTVTFDGLCEQLLQAVVDNEIPEVTARKTQLMLQLAADQKALRGLEDKILKLLSDSKGNILDDENLITTLSASKKTSTEITRRVQEAEKAKVEIEQAYALYKGVARRGSLLYFVIADLANIDPMYQFSLLYFARLFNRTIRQSRACDSLDARLGVLSADVTRAVFVDTTRGLFEAHKLLLSFLFATAIFRDSGEISQAEWMLLLRGSDAKTATSQAENPFPEELVGEKQWSYLATVAATSAALKELQLDVIAEADAWREWAQSETPHLTPLPGKYAEISAFQKLLVLRGFRAEKVIDGVTVFVRAKLGGAFTEFPLPTMEEVYVDSTKTTPIIFVLSTGADPTEMLLRFAKEKQQQAAGGSAGNLQMISLGQGQGPRAQRLIEQGEKEGWWVLLQNCHLAKSWMPVLAKLVESLEETAGAVHADFRLFLTSMPASYFPVPVLQAGIKLTNEPPKGIRANLLRSYQAMTDEQLAHAVEGTLAPEWRKLQFSLRLFHAVVQERRKFGPLGWNIRYEFNDSDLETSTTVLSNMLGASDATAVPWDTLLFVIGQINYGGRVTDDWDRRLLMAMLSRFLASDAVAHTQFAFSPSGVYRMFQDVENADIAGFRTYINTLPLTDAPEIFGMHQNANITFQQQESMSILNAALGIQPRDSGSGGGKDLTTAVVLQTAQSMLASLPAKLVYEAPAVAAAGGVPDSLSTCLMQETERFNKLLKTIEKTLNELIKAINGFAVMTAELDGLFTAILNNSQPKLWQNASYPSLKPLASWFEDLLARVEFLRDWTLSGSTKPIAFWISAFFFPQGFLTAVLQGYARATKTPVDVLGFEFAVQDFIDPYEAIDTAPDQGVLIYGLFLDGCRWDFDEMALAEQDPGVMFVPAPTIHFIPAPNVKPDASKYLCPLYKTGVRAGTLSTTGHSTNFVLPVELDTKENPQHWILRGAALLTMLND